ncbi:hypothetical protein [Sphingosinithalassobacter portus]|uniref:hypothetical protein n=1 Tax=Stakelama portus TaxID=2676234 RepID=UPI000D6E2038|nr:hypothetical protein [Sphingosinithalassobacter portus]
MSDHELDWIRLAARRAKGKRPDYFEDPATDLLLTMVTALTAELSVQRQRGDTLERLLEAKGIVSREEIENWRPDQSEAEERGIATRAYIARVMRGVQQAVEAMKVDERPLDEIGKDLMAS